MQKRLNRLRCHFGWALGWAWGTMYYMGAQIRMRRGRATHVKYRDAVPWAVQQEGHAVTGNHYTMQGTCTESLHLHSHQATQWIEITLLANMGKFSKSTLGLRLWSAAIIRYVNGWFYASSGVSCTRGAYLNELVGFPAFGNFVMFASSWATICKTVRPYAIGPLSFLSVLSVLFVCNVGVLWPNDLMELGVGVIVWDLYYSLSEPDFWISS